MKRTPEPADAEALAYAGILGHHYVITADDGKGGRRSVTETDDPDTVAEPHHEDPRTFEQVLLQKGGRRWRRVR